MIKATVQNVIPNGRHGPYFVATSDQIEGYVTCSLDPQIWRESREPTESEIVALDDVTKKRTKRKSNTSNGAKSSDEGWRANSARFWRLSDEQHSS